MIRTALGAGAAEDCQKDSLVALATVHQRVAVVMPLKTCLVVELVVLRQKGYFWVELLLTQMGYYCSVEQLARFVVVERTERRMD